MGDRPAESRRRDRREPTGAMRAVPGPVVAGSGTAGPVDPSRAPLPPEHRRRWLVGTVVTVVLAVAAVVGGPWVYARLVSGPGDEPLGLSSPTATATVPPGPPASIDVDGTWQVSTGSQGGYRIGEVLSGTAVVVVGRTDLVTGSVTVAEGSLTAARVAVDTATITTDESARDAYFRRALDTSTYPEAVFELVAPVDVSAVGTAPEPVSVLAEGTMTLRGVTLPATATLLVQRTVDGIEVVATVPITLADFELEPPDLGFVTVDPTGTVELLLVLVR
ncbi:MAG TPA: YceI family protein [Actinotalea sp.]|nr:YceI family protein [Actinotalea sp.]HRA51545.1 YceI family protein [Actinotalea sp.]